MFPFKIIIIPALAMLGAMAIEQDTLRRVQPAWVAVSREVAGIEADNCTSLSSPTLNTAGDEEYIRCIDPTRITDSSIGQPNFTQDTLNSVYIWQGEPDEVLFMFSSYKTISSITIHYYANQDDQGLPKLRFFAVPEDFEIGDSIGTDSGYPTTLIDEIAPGNEDTGLTNKTRNVVFNTTKILMEKGRTKNYQFYLSEIEFFTSDPDCVDVIATTASTTLPPTAQTTTAPTTGTTVSTETTASVETTTEAKTEEELEATSSLSVETNVSGESRVHSRVNTLHLIPLTLLGALMMAR